MAIAGGPDEAWCTAGSGEQDEPRQHVELQIPMAGAMAVAAKQSTGCRWQK